LFALAADGSRRELELESSWPHKGGIVLKFKGVDSINDAERLIGCEVQIPLEQRAPLEPGATYIADLLGCEVVADGRAIGRIEDVQRAAGEAPLLVVKSGTKEYMIPFATEFVKSLDVAGKRLEMLLPEGLLDLDAPLSEEEKREQRRE
jgi:16S rRNA processing protein RimM